MQITVAEHQISPDNLAHITNFPHHTGIYYEYRELLKLAHQEWNLINFIDLSQYNSKHQNLKSFYDETADVCKDVKNKISVSNFALACQQFSQTTHPYLMEIEANHANI